ncbi:hypothetical protein FEM48_Zijuj08G0133600 [Ziziphus jujuba var. spinosa]|uniref:Pentatricopeptide repeat-containing protein n=1 Tax=Ziziphus jujuba var. spinosa TaxID=714518 RepID=A0A978UZC4_ZIZJJ|nr:hypothetical protein FEM48_Zijuj08G0133600 [Ziziphus jujuba var. spinosa]
MKLALYKESIASLTETAAKQLIKLNRTLGELIRSNRYSDSLQRFTQIHSSQNPKPDHYTLSTALTACANTRNVVLGNQLHAHAIRTSIKSYAHVANTLLSLYAKAEDLSSVKKVFNEIERPDVYSWTTLIGDWRRNELEVTFFTTYQIIRGRLQRGPDLVHHKEKNIMQEVVLKFHRPENALRGSLLSKTGLS